MTNVIKGAFVDCIERIIFLDALQPNKTKEICFDSFSDKEEIIKSLQSCVYFSIEGDEIFCEVYKSEEETQRDEKENIDRKIANITQLKKWYSQNDENKEQITSYLNRRKLDWILAEIL